MLVDKNKSQDVKKLVNELKIKNEVEAEYQKKDYRPWGNFETLVMEKEFHVKILTILPGESLSLQKHKYRAENWVVVKGEAYITINNEKKLKVGNHFYSKEAMHRLENKGIEILQIDWYRLVVISARMILRDLKINMQDNYRIKISWKKIK